jgi:hypothetical protein
MDFFLLGKNPEILHSPNLNLTKKSQIRLRTLGLGLDLIVLGQSLSLKVLELPWAFESSTKSFGTRK